MEKENNEQLCVMAQNGDDFAKSSLIVNNLAFIKKTAFELWNAQQDLNSSIGIETDDLVQEGSLGLLACIDSFRIDSGYKFLTYAAPAIRNSMLDYIRTQSATFETRLTDVILHIDNAVGDGQNSQYEFIADTTVLNPEQIYLLKERHMEIHKALRKITPRESTYLRYRFGFQDDFEHPLWETAKHFHLSESRAKSTELTAIDNIWLELPWWFG